MIGLLIMSHGKMAEGIEDSLKLLWGGDIEKLKTICLGYEDSSEEFDDKVKEALKELDDGSGVIGICDLVGGTPCNRCMSLANDNFKVVVGANLGLCLELLGRRLSASNVSEIDIPELLDTARQTMIYINEIIEE